MNPLTQFKKILILPLLIALALVVIQVIPRALGQRDASKRSSDVEIPLLKQQPAPLEPAVCSSWTPTGSLNDARELHTVTLLPNGMVLVAGGGGNGGLLASAELYDPASGTWPPSGMVLVAGGFSGGNFLASAELYDPASGTWTPTGSLNATRIEHTATLLPNGMVLVAGGYNNGPLASAELYHPASGT